MLLSVVCMQVLHTLSCRTGRKEGLIIEDGEWIQLELGETEILYSLCLRYESSNFNNRLGPFEINAKFVPHDRIVVTNFDPSRVTSRSHFVINPSNEWRPYKRPRFLE